MSMEYIRRCYGVPAKRGAKVRITSPKDQDVTFDGVIVASKGARIRVKIAGGKRPLTYHPTDVEYV